MKFLESVPTLGKNVLDGLSLVEDHELPFQSFKGLLIGHSQLIGSNDHMEGRICLLCKLFRGEELSYGLSLLDIAPVRQHLQRWAELFELLLPVVKSTVRSND